MKGTVGCISLKTFKPHSNYAAPSDDRLGSGNRQSPDDSSHPAMVI